MIRFVAQNRKASVQLLNKKQTHHLMGKRHGGKRNFALCFFVHLVTETVRAANDENKGFYAGIHLLLQFFGKAYAGERFTVFIQKDQLVGRSEF